MGMSRFYVSRRETLLHVDTLHHGIVVEDLDLYSRWKLEDPAHVIAFPRHLVVVNGLERMIETIFGFFGGFRLCHIASPPFTRSLP